MPILISDYLDICDPVLTFDRFMEEMDLEKYLNSEEARKIPADTVNHLEKSFEEMKKTSSALKELL